MINCCKDSKEQCIICLDSKKIYLECKKCYSCKICKDCVLPLTKSNLADKCPLCRETEWKLSRSLSNQIIPEDIELNFKERIKKIYEKPPIKEMCKCCNKETYNTMRYICTVAWYASLIIFISYMVGLLFVFICIEGSNLSNINPLVFILVPLPLGFLIISLAGCCCCYTECCRYTRISLCEREEYY